MKLTVFNQ